VRIGELFREAIRCNAAAMVLIDKHPSARAICAASVGALPRTVLAVGLGN
jgi:RadC-like JAB domain